MTFDTATAQTAVEVDYSLPEYSGEELAEMEREDEAYFTLKFRAYLKEVDERLDKSLASALNNTQVSHG